MARPARNRKICSIPRFRIFEAYEGNTADSDDGSIDRQTGTGTGVNLTLDEYEAIRMIDYLGRTHEQCAAHMGISRTTVTEIYERARYKLSDMLVNGKELTIEGGSILVCEGSAAGGCLPSCGVLCASEKSAT